MAKAPAGSGTVDKQEPSATEIALLRFPLTDAEDARIEEVLEVSLRQYEQTSGETIGDPS